MGFAATASYFELRARRSRDPDAQKRLQEVAGFYRKLADIAPDFPPGCIVDYKRLFEVNRWKARAEECRTMADSFTSPTCRQQMAQLADTYDRLAIAAE